MPRALFKPAASDPPGHHQGDLEVWVRHCEILSSNGLVSVVGSMVAAILMVYVLRGAAPAHRQLAWLGSLVVLLVLRLWIWAGWRREPAGDLPRIGRFLRNYRLLITFSGMVWGASPWLLQRGNDLTHDSIIAFVLAGIGAGGVTALAVDTYCVRAFLFTTVGPLIIRFMLAGDGVRQAMAAMGVLFLSFMAISGVRIGRAVADNLRLNREAELREQTLRDSEDRLKRAQHVARLGSFDWEVATGQVRWSDEHFRLWGMAAGAADPSGRLFLQGVHPEDRQRVGSAISDAVRLGRGYECMHRVCHPDGRELHVHERAEVVKDADGQVVRVIGTVQDVTASRTAEERIRHLAYYDPLTGLPNRHLLLERLQSVLDRGEAGDVHGALFFIDLDNFKNLNDTCGHDQGDLLLRQVADRLQRCVREDDMVARLGGDEFVVLLADLAAGYAEAVEPAGGVAEAILTSLQVPYVLPAREYHSTSSIGVAVFDARRTVVEDLLKRADLAMYHAKAAGRDTICFFTPEMEANATERAALEADLRDAVRDGGFELYLQGQVDIEGSWIGAEALLRWPHPVRGMVSPADMIPVAEESGLILPIGQWVLERACGILVEWSNRPLLAELTLAVNVSARQFRQADFVAQVVEAIERSGADPRRLKIELTESLLLTDVEGAIRKMAALRAHGVGFALDDFGIGYSSLSYLKRLPLDQLKIDKTFVQDVLVDPNDAAIAYMILALGQSLGLQVIAEGVETEGQRAFLAQRGCQGFQGYLFNRPLPVDRFADTILASSPAVNGRVALA